MKKRRSFHEQEELINLTPLLDVLFVVLVMFILITPLINTDNIDLTKVEMQKNDSSMQDQDNLKILVHRDNTIAINNKKVTYSELKLIANKIRNHNQVQLFCDQKANFGTYQRIKSMMQEAGFKELQVVIDHE